MQTVIDFFTKSCERYGNCSWKASKMLSEDYQENCYSLLSGFINQEVTVLDVGCGQGTYYQFLKSRGFKGVYEGIDITPKMIEIARRKYPEARFALIDILDQGFNKEYDLVIGVGTFNVKVDNHFEYAKQALKKMYDICKKGCALTMLSHHGYEKAKYLNELYCYEPGDVLSYCLTLTSNVKIDHGSLPAEFILKMYK